MESTYGLDRTVLALLCEAYDEEVVDEIYDYFREEASSDSVSEAIAALGGDYEELEIRLVRIKFLCEIAS